jgi:hypothetical protein
MKYTKAVDVWALSQEQRKQLQVGQWVLAGSGGAKGQWLGQKASGSDVAAWHHYGIKGWRAKVSTLRAYAKNWS